MKKNKRNKNSVSIILISLLSGLAVLSAILFLGSLMIAKEIVDINKIELLLIIAYIVSTTLIGILISIKKKGGSLIHSILTAFLMVIVHLLVSIASGKGSPGKDTLIIIFAAFAGSVLGNKAPKMLKNSCKRTNKRY